MFEFMSDLKRNPSIVKRLELYENGFFPVSMIELKQAELSLGFDFPSELRSFYEEIGEGRLQTGRNGNFTDNNHIASPSEVVAILKGTSDWLTPYSELQPGVLPFFQRDIDLFLCLHPQSNNPNAVQWMWGGEYAILWLNFFNDWL
jgi:hypothetical protein